MAGDTALDAFPAVGASLSPGAPATGPAAGIMPLLTSIQAFNGGVKFGDNVAITGQLTASSPQNATALNAVIKLGAGKGFRIDLDFCKGCGLCAAECPCGAIDMVAEPVG